MVTLWQWIRWDVLFSKFSHPPGVRAPFALFLLTHLRQFYLLPAYPSIWFTAILDEIETFAFAFAQKWTLPLREIFFDIKVFTQWFESVLPIARGAQHMIYCHFWRCKKEVKQMMWWINGSVIYRFSPFFGFHVPISWDVLFCHFSHPLGVRAPFVPPFFLDFLTKWWVKWWVCVLSQGVPLHRMRKCVILTMWKFKWKSEWWVTGGVFIDLMVEFVLFITYTCRD